MTGGLMPVGTNKMPGSRWYFQKPDKAEFVTTVKTWQPNKQQLKTMPLHRQIQKQLSVGGHRLPAAFLPAAGYILQHQLKH